MKRRALHPGTTVTRSRAREYLVTISAVVALIFCSASMVPAQTFQAQASAEKLLFSFVSQDGVDPLAGLVRDAAG